MVISKTNGKFTEYRGFIEMDPDTQQVKAIEAVIQTQSVFTDHKKRDKHLRSPDFFDVEKFPTMTYTMKSYKKTGDTFTALGDLTLLGITKEITLVGTMMVALMSNLTLLAALLMVFKPLGAESAQEPIPD